MPLSSGSSVSMFTISAFVNAISTTPSVPVQAVGDAEACRRPSRRWHRCRALAATVRPAPAAAMALRLSLAAHLERLLPDGGLRTAAFRATPGAVPARAAGPVE